MIFWLIFIYIYIYSHQLGKTFLFDYHTYTDHFRPMPTTRIMLSLGLHACKSISVGLCYDTINLVYGESWLVRLQKSCALIIILANSKAQIVNRGVRLLVLKGNIACGSPPTPRLGHIFRGHVGGFKSTVCQNSSCYWCKLLSVLLFLSLFNSPKCNQAWFMRHHKMLWDHQETCFLPTNMHRFFFLPLTFQILIPNKKMRGFLTGN